ncbi:MAG: hypothetical protein ABMB14_33315 [Myxococcota bacterium]
MRTAWTILALPSISGCWKDDLAEIPPDVLQFQPEIEAPPGWLVAPVAVDLACPDGEDGRFYVVYPESAAEEGAAPISAAVVYHSGSFDFVFAPDPSDPLAGTHYSDPPRLTAAWAIDQVFVTLGMYPELDAVEVHDGSLPVALAEQGIAMMIPANCWGDLWANKPGSTDNDFASDFFFREGKAAAEWSYRFLVDPAFAAAFDVELPFAVDPASVYAIGLGEGSRGVAELLAIDNDADGTPDFTVAGALVDAPFDDLRVYFADSGLYASTIEGLTRIYPAGVDATEAGSLWSARLPDRFGVVASTADPVWPSELVDPLLGRLGPSQWASVVSDPVHIRTNGGGDPDLARTAVEYLVTGVVPTVR